MAVLKIAFKAECTELLDQIDEADLEAVLSILFAYARRSSAAAVAN